MEGKPEEVDEAYYEYLEAERERIEEKERNAEIENQGSVK